MGGDEYAVGILVGHLVAFVPVLDIATGLSSTVQPKHVTQQVGDCLSLKLTLKGSEAGTYNTAAAFTCDEGQRGQASVRTQLIAPKLAVKKTGPRQLTRGEVGVYTITVTNIGKAPAEKVRVTGDKLKQKLYYRHSGYPGALKSTSLGEKMQSDPAWVIEHAVRGMLPRNRLGASMIKKLKVYVGNTHPHLAQTEGASKRVKN